MEFEDTEAEFIRGLAELRVPIVLVLTRAMKTPSGEIHPDTVEFAQYLLSDEVQQGFAENSMGLPTNPAATGSVASAATNSAGLSPRRTARSKPRGISTPNNTLPDCKRSSNSATLSTNTNSRPCAICWVRRWRVSGSLPRRWPSRTSLPT